MIQITKKVTGKKYWQSLDQLYQTPEFQKWLSREFPETATEAVDETSRRNILKLMAASFGLAGLTACRRPAEHILPTARGIEGFIHGRPLFYNTAMTLGGGTLGLMVETNEGRPTKIEGNPKHPLSLGKTKGYHQASVLDLYDPDRAYAVRRGTTDAKWDEFTGFVNQWKGGANAAGIRVLSERVNSPSFDAVRRHFLTRFAGAKWFEYEPLLTSETTRSSTAQLALDKADVVVALDSDFLGLDSTTVLNARKFGERRAQLDQTQTMNRLYVVESQMSTTGGAADHRLPLKSSEIGRFATSLLNQLRAAGGNLTGIGTGSTAENRFVAALAKDLAASRGRSLVVAGPRQPEGVHDVVRQINEALGNVGQTVTYRSGGRTRSYADELRELNSEMAGGQVDTLIILAWNPVFTAPADLDFAANLKKVRTSIYLAKDYDETAKLATWTVPATHYLETWGDAVSADGTVTIQQPTIQPLHAGATAPAELIALLSDYKDKTSFEIVRNHWLPTLGADNAKGWRMALHEGVVGGAGSPGASAASAAAAGMATSANAAASTPSNTAASATAGAVGAAAVNAAPSTAAGWEVVFVPSWSLWDGRFANNGWMQEAPDPMTTLTWDNAALVSEADAKKLGDLKNGHMITIERGGRRIEAPIIVQPGQVPGSVTIALGYGRTECGRIGKGVGVNAYAIRTTDAFGFGTGYNVSAAGGTYKLALTQEWHRMEEPKLVDFQPDQTRPIVREGTLEQYKANPDFAQEMVHHPPLKSLYGDYDYSRGQQWGMSIDLNACVGCNSCIVACQAENNIPIVGKEQVARGREMHWIRMDRYFTGPSENPEVACMPMMCVHCETAPCENVCPVAATVHTPEGLNDMVYNRCVGTRYCSNNCPYKVRRFNFLSWHEGTEEVQRMAYNPDVTVRMRGVMEKCTYCVQRIQEKKIELRATENRRWIKDGEVQTACAQACPTDAIVFGNLNDPESRVAKLKLSPRNYAVLGEINTKPRGTFLAKVRNPNPELEPAAAQPAAGGGHHG